MRKEVLDTIQRHRKALGLSVSEQIIDGVKTIVRSDGPIDLDQSVVYKALYLDPAATLIDEKDKKIMELEDRIRQLSSREIYRLTAENETLRKERDALADQIKALVPEPEPKPRDNPFQRRHDGRAPDMREDRK